MAERLDAAGRDRLFDAVRPLGAAFDDDERRAARAVYRLLVDGCPVTARAVAAATGWHPRRAGRFIDDLPHAEHDDQGRVVGFGGLTLRRTAHRVVVDGAVRYAWCAWDTLFLPIALDADVKVTSTCPQTGREVVLTVGPSGVVERDPATAVLSFVRPDGDAAADLHGGFCALIHFFTDDDAATAWTAGVPGTFPLDLDDAFDLGRRCIHDRYGTPAGE